MVKITEIPLPNRGVYVTNLDEGEAFVYEGSLYIKAPFKPQQGICVMFLGDLKDPDKAPKAFSARDYTDWTGIIVEPVDIEILVVHK